MRPAVRILPAAEQSAPASSLRSLAGLITILHIFAPDILKSHCMNQSTLISELQAFCSNTLQYYNCGYPYGPFLPYTMPNYNKAIEKIFYIGRDTYGWVDKSVLVSSFHENNFNEYIDANFNVVSINNLVDPVWTNNPTSFWGFVSRLHLLILTGIYQTDMECLTDNDINALSQLGYGNLYSIELPDTLSDIYKNISPKSSYKMICKEAHRFEKIKLILDLYAPDYIIILSWSNREDIFEGLQPINHQEWYKDGILSVYTINEYHTKVLWSAHPRRFSYLGITPENAINMLANTLIKMREI